MRKVVYTAQAKKDLKRIAHNPEKKLIFEEFVRKLRNDEEIPKENKPHPLKGKYLGIMECHMGPDYLLIWYDKVRDILEIVRVGSHSELILSKISIVGDFYPLVFVFSLS